jgi:hypothetical protein
VSARNIVDVAMPWLVLLPLVLIFGPRGLRLIGAIICISLSVGFAAWHGHSIRTNLGKEKLDALITSYLFAVVLYASWLGLWFAIGLTTLLKWVRKKSAGANNPGQS